ncbi:MAG: PDC sensor domain-containing protein [Magnetovibrio sp.]|nr:PDC sensor domain-containing protein [Magnetovibrio sp.]
MSVMVDNSELQSDIRSAIFKQREMLTSMISRAMRKLSHDCVDLMHNREAMEARLTKALDEIPYCKHLYVMNIDGIQTVDNITRTGADHAHYGRDRSKRPYMLGVLASGNFRLSEAYISKNSKRPSLTAIRVIRDSNSKHVGFLGADYDLRELPATQGLYEEKQDWQQIKGDPSIRGNLFEQQRVDSQLDSRLDDAIPLLTELMMHHGVFHSKIHFSSSRATIWQVDNPFGYRLLGFEDLIDPNTCLAYPHRDYMKQATVPPETLNPIFEMFRELRFADDNIYLRSGSINICNGMVALNFSCDGSHYIRYDEFLKNGIEFWFGTAG